MKVAILSESPSDEAAIRILAQAVLRRPIEPVMPRLRAGGWASVVLAVPSELRRLYYNTDAEGLIIVVDSDDSPVHVPSHQNTPQFDCRVCQIQMALQPAWAAMKWTAGRAELNVAVGLPVPAIEAWLRCGKDPHAAEAPFLRELSAGRTMEQVRRKLKQDVYGADHPSRDHQMAVVVEEARRISLDLERLRTQFPLGFGTLYETLLTWR